MSPRERPSPPEFFIDRSLGRRFVADALTAHGLSVHTLASVYGEQEGQRVADETWLHDAGSRGWVVLMKDDAVRRRPAEIEAVRVANVRAFCLTNAQMTGAQQAARFVYHRHRIVRVSAKPGPFIYGVYEKHLAKLWPR